jgi:putative transposase
MNFEEGRLYHLYNQGNQKQRIFFNRDNYLFFLSKIRRYILPYADILAWCLMPNHFHLMLYVTRLEINVEEKVDPVPNSEGFTRSEARTAKRRTLNQSIGLLLRSYTRAINRQQGISGSLFRKETKAECLNSNDCIQPAFFNTSSGTIVNVPSLDKEYPQICFDYIHSNPVCAGLVNRVEEWEFSSARDYFSKRGGTLVEKEIAKEFGIKW